uniref:Alpha-galactosidase n=1 Tax=Fagus sylvatica TaxID=28930 RepID=A0A2N9HBZ3_FAGSY
MIMSWRGSSLFVLVTFVVLCSVKVTSHAMNLTNSTNIAHQEYTQFLLANGVARTPPMGWNSWNHFQCNISEWTVKTTADALVSTGLAALGYKYINIDDCWGEENRDLGGNLRAKHSTFPSGIKALADYVHAKGLKLGIYSDAGKKMPGSLGHEDQDARTFSEWGIDYLKYDNCYHDGSKPLDRYARMSYALQKVGRPILYAICGALDGKAGNCIFLCFVVVGGGFLFGDALGNDLGQVLTEKYTCRGQEDPAKWASRYGNAWRTTVSLISQMKTTFGEDMQDLAGGMAPLLIGCDIRSASRETLRILGNKEVIDVNQDPLGVQARKIQSKGRSRGLGRAIINEKSGDSVME